MGRYVLKKDEVFIDSFLNATKLESYALDRLDAKLLNGQLLDKNGDAKNLHEIFEENGLSLFELRIFTDPYMIQEKDIVNVHIEDGQLVITQNNGKHKKI